jgi:hypothetical protein
LVLVVTSAIVSLRGHSGVRGKLNEAERCLTRQKLADIAFDVDYNLLARNLEVLINKAIPSLRRA